MSLAQQFETVTILTIRLANKTDHISKRQNWLEWKEIYLRIKRLFLKQSLDTTALDEIYLKVYKAYFKFTPDDSEEDLAEFAKTIFV